MVAAASRIPLAAGLIAAAFLAWQAGPYTSIIQTNRGFERPADVVAFIEQNSSPQDYVLMIGAEAGVNFEARRESPTRFAYQYPCSERATLNPKNSRSST